MGSHVLFVTRSDIILKMIGILTLVIILSTWTTAVPSFHTSNNKTDIQTEKKAKAKCMTVSGPSKEELCVFPFIFTGRMYSKGEHVQGNYGFCDKTCSEGLNTDTKLKEP